MNNIIISKKFQKKIKKEIHHLEKLSKQNWKKINELEIRMYNPNSKWNQKIFRKHKYECKIYVGDEVIYLEENQCFKDLVEKIGLSIDK
jgi:CRISPR/Cas system CMR-associated protein Cmr1 (group 7 of RAMP superfamily)